MHRFRKTGSNMVAVVQLVRASDCGSECRRFESDQPPLVGEQRNLFSNFFLLRFKVLFLLLLITFYNETYNFLLAPAFLAYSIRL